MPYDSFGDIFVKDRKYDKKQYQKLVTSLNSIPWLKRVDGFGRVAVYETPNVKDRFWTESSGDVSYVSLSPTEYHIKVVINKPATLVFNEQYNPYWIAQTDSQKLINKKTKEGFNSFFLPNKGNYEVKIYFSKQAFYDIGRIIAFATLLLLILIFVYLRRTAHFKK